MKEDIADVISRLHLVKKQNKRASSVYPGMTPVMNYMVDLDRALDWMFEFVLAGALPAGWIDAKKVLPDPEVSVLIHVPGTVQEVQIGFLTKEGVWRSIFLDIDYVKPITHWMAIPRVPKEKGDGSE